MQSLCVARGGYMKAAAPIPSWPVWLMDLLRPVGSLEALLLPVPPFHPVTPVLRREGGREPRAGAERQRCARRHVKNSWTALPDCKLLLGVREPSSFSLCKGRGCAQGAAEPTARSELKPELSPAGNLSPCAREDRSTPSTDQGHGLRPGTDVLELRRSVERSWASWHAAGPHASFVTGLQSSEETATASTELLTVRAALGRDCFAQV